MKHSLPISFLICMVLLGCVAAKEVKEEKRWGFYFTKDSTGLIEIHKYSTEIKQ